MKKYLLYPHGGSGNHGCEAIVRSTLRILDNPQSDQVYLYSMNCDQDEKVGLSDICSLKPYITNVKRFSPEHISAAIKYHIQKNKEAFDILSFQELLSKADSDTVALSIGGDNYCYGAPEQIYFINKHLRSRGAKTILWGCSVEPSAIDAIMAEDLAGYELITARESISYGALKEINENTILCSDPAFQLDAESCELPESFIAGNTVGINISPMVGSLESSPGILIENCKSLIRWILDETDMTVALIPHVCWETNDDRTLLKRLYEEFQDGARIVEIQEHNCKQLKYIISKCRFMIAARTHASIAAYSTCVPTLVIGYSVKSRGIARDIFGTEEKYIVSIEDIKTDEYILRSFQAIVNNESDIKTYLKQEMPEYCQKAFLASDELKARGWM